VSFKVLYTFVGNRDPYVDEENGQYGPILCHLESKEYSHVYLICTGESYFERAKMVESIALEETGVKRIHFLNLDLESPIDYEEIYVKLKDALERTKNQLPSEQVSRTVLLDPGTPQMQTAWFLLVKSGTFRAKLVQGIPPRFAGGAYKAREVTLAKGVLPDIILPKEDNTTPAKRDIPEVQTSDRWISSFDIKILGHAPVLQKALARAKQLAKYDDLSVLLLGETGTGKGLFAKLLHALSGRTNGPLVSLDCSAISPNLVESELFGYVKGAFTGSDGERLGRFRTADGGIIFLDEIGDLPMNLQPKLLKVIEEKKLSPVGSDKEIAVNVRIIAATHIDLEEAVEKGSFRRDLYTRLNQTSIHLPSLRERTEDLAELAESFLDEWNRKYGEFRKFSPECWNYFQTYPWPGNVRELYNAIRTMCGTTQGEELGIDSFPSAILSFFNKEQPLRPPAAEIPEEGVDLKAILYDLEKQYYEKALESAEGNREKAAALLGINGPAFRKALRERFRIDEGETAP
jgi:DNA-binding NtrC family response regulator